MCTFRNPPPNIELRYPVPGTVLEKVCGRALVGEKPHAMQFYPRWMNEQIVRLSPQRNEKFIFIKIKEIINPCLLKFPVFRIRIHWVRIRIHDFDDQKFDQKLLHKGPQSYRRSLRPSKENIQHFKTCFLFFFVFLWVIFALPDPESESWLNPNPVWTRIRDTEKF